MRCNIKMMEQLNEKRLPIDVQAFEIMRREKYVYVDKTHHIYNMVTKGRYYFLSRPRRFGKSLLISALECFFQGKKELFEGLWIAEHGQWEWNEHPVILFDFSNIINDSPENLKRDIANRLTRLAAQYHIDVSSSLLTSQFSELILTLYRKASMPVVVLIDEYDKPIIDHLGKGEERFHVAEANRDVLKSFFGVLKSVELAPFLRFVFLTGISRFSKVSIFSDLNNLRDLTMHAAYADMLGYTQQEVEMCFKPYIKQLAEKLGCSIEQVIAALTQQYNGYRFSEKEVRVYNPFSILNAFEELEIKDYWFETATPSFLIHLLKQEQYEFPEIENLLMLKSMTTYNLENLAPEVLLFQTGYVTIKEIQNGAYILDYPNQEVKQAFIDHILFSHTEGIHRKVRSYVLQLPRYLRNKDFETFFETMQAIFASIPYDIESKRDEAYFHTIFYLVLSASGLAAQSSVLTCEGRLDLVVTLPDKVYIIEFKCNQSPEAAIRQIQEKHYADPYRQGGKEIILMGINFDSKKRNLVQWSIVEE